MALLTLNGMEIPVSVETGADADEVLGSRSRAEGGGRFSSVTAIKRAIPIQTNLVSRDFAESLRRLLRGEGDTWPFAADFWNGKGLPAIAGYQATLRALEGHTAGTAALAVEEVRTNSFLQSEDPLTTWARTRLNTGGLTTAPDGTNTSRLLVPDTSTNTHLIQQTLPALTDNTPQSVSGYHKAGGLNYIAVRTTTKAGATPQTWFNVATGVTGTVSGSHVVTIKPAENGHYRWTVEWNCGAGGTTPTVIVFVTNADGVVSFTGNGTDGVYQWGMQLEADKPSATSYIKTTTVPVARAAAGFVGYDVGQPWESFTAACWAWAGKSAYIRGFCGASPDWHLSTNDGATNDVRFAWTDAAGASQVLNTGAIGGGLNVGTGWHHYAVTYHRPTTTVCIYVDGVLRGTSTSASMRTAFTGTFGWGDIRGNAASSPLNGLLSDGLLLPAAVSAEVIAGLYVDGAVGALKALPTLRAGGDLFRGRYVDVEGEKVRLQPVAMATGTKWRVSFDLVEV